MKCSESFKRGDFKLHIRGIICGRIKWKKKCCGEYNERQNPDIYYMYMCAVCVCVWWFGDVENTNGA